MLFRHKADSWADWSVALRSEGAFTPLLRSICNRQHIVWDAPQRLLSAENAVFRVGDVVVKIFRPEEGEPLQGGRCRLEGDILRSAARHPLPTPTLLAEGEVLDRYLFGYLILRHIEGTHASDLVRPAPRATQFDIASRVGVLCAQVHALDPPTQLRAGAVFERVLDNPRWHNFSSSFRWQICERAASLQNEALTLVHGDLCGENLLRRENGAFMLIDFTDAVLAPACYDLPPAILELFGGDFALAQIFSGIEDATALIEALIDGIALHEYGASFAGAILASVGIPSQQADSLNTLRRSLWRKFSLL